MSKINIFVPIYFREEQVKKSLDSLLKTAKVPNEDVTIVLVDNKSNDELRTWLLTLQSDKVKVELLDKNIGKAAAITAMTAKYSDYDYFVNFDSDLICLTENWLEILVNCFRKIDKAGMVAVNYINNGNYPHPQQPKEEKIDTYTYQYGGGVAGGCFITSKELWINSRGYERSTGVYGGVDGQWRLAVASMGYKCGYISEVLFEHPYDKETEYFAWKIKIQHNLQQHGFKSPNEIIENHKGFYDK
jgi:glycosyltransferase involved in cell wall biosynthesis